MPHICNEWLLKVRKETRRLILNWGCVIKENNIRKAHSLLGLDAGWRKRLEESTFWGASCSGTSHSSSEAAGSCIPSNCFRSPMATASADVECRKQWELKQRVQEDWAWRKDRRMGALTSGPDTIHSDLWTERTLTAAPVHSASFLIILRHVSIEQNTQAHT